MPGYCNFLWLENNFYAPGSNYPFKRHAYWPWLFILKSILKNILALKIYPNSITFFPAISGNRLFQKCSKASGQGPTKPVQLIRGRRPTIAGHQTQPRTDVSVTTNTRCDRPAETSAEARTGKAECGHDSTEHGDRAAKSVKRTAV